MYLLKKKAKPIAMKIIAKAIEEECPYIRIIIPIRMNAIPV